MSRINERKCWGPAWGLVLLVTLMGMMSRVNAAFVASIYTDSLCATAIESRLSLSAVATDIELGAQRAVCQPLLQYSGISFSQRSVCVASSSTSGNIEFSALLFTNSATCTSDTSPVVISSIPLPLDSSPLVKASSPCTPLHHFPDSNITLFVAVSCELAAPARFSVADDPATTPPPDAATTTVPPDSGTTPPPDAGTTSAPVDCLSFTSCDTCTPIRGCGWCSSSGLCVTGNSTGPTTASCDPHSWSYVAQNCPDAPDPCKTNGACETCTTSTNGANCGWCNEQCWSGHYVGPTVNGSCARTPWAFKIAQCPPKESVDNSTNQVNLCAVHNTSCATCAGNSACGWCGGSCYEGDLNGPYIRDTCGTALWAFQTDLCPDTTSNLTYTPQWNNVQIPSEWVVLNGGRATSNHISLSASSQTGSWSCDMTTTYGALIYEPSTSSLITNVPLFATNRFNNGKMSNCPAFVPVGVIGGCGPAFLTAYSSVVDLRTTGFTFNVSAKDSLFGFRAGGFASAHTVGVLNNGQTLVITAMDTTCATWMAPTAMLLAITTNSTTAMLNDPALLSSTPRFFRIPVSPYVNVQSFNGWVFVHSSTCDDSVESNLVLVSGKVGTCFAVSGIMLDDMQTRMQSARVTCNDIAWSIELYSSAQCISSGAAGSVLMTQMSAATGTTCGVNTTMTNFTTTTTFLSSENKTIITTTTTFATSALSAVINCLPFSATIAPNASIAPSVSPTSAATTASPSSPASTTATPTSSIPTTPAVTSVSPTTPRPSTSSTTPSVSTTHAPTTAAPSTNFVSPSPSTARPSTASPTVAPSTALPSTSSPTSAISSDPLAQASITLAFSTVPTSSQMTDLTTLLATTASISSTRLTLTLPDGVQPQHAPSQPRFLQFLRQDDRLNTAHRAPSQLSSSQSSASEFGVEEDKATTIVTTLTILAGSNPSVPEAMASLLDALNPPSGSLLLSALFQTLGFQRTKSNLVPRYTCSDLSITSPCASVNLDTTNNNGFFTQSSNVAWVVVVIVVIVVSLAAAIVCFRRRKQRKLDHGLEGIRQRTEFDTEMEGPYQRTGGNVPIENSTGIGSLALYEGPAGPTSSANSLQGQKSNKSAARSQYHQAQRESRSEQGEGDLRIVNTQ